MIFPFSPAYQNLSADYDSLTNGAQTEGDFPKEDQGDEKTEKTSIVQNPLLKMILSSRNHYFENTYSDYVHSGFLQKLFGLGYAGFYESSPKLIEMDFFDLFFSFGIIGFIVFFLPVLYMFFIVLRKLLIHWKTFFRLENLLLLLSTCLGFGIAFFAGHVLSAPAVSIYMAIILVLVLVFNYNTENTISHLK